MCAPSFKRRDRHGHDGHNGGHGRARHGGDDGDRPKRLTATEFRRRSRTNSLASLGAGSSNSGGGFDLAKGPGL